MTRTGIILTLALFVSGAIATVPQMASADEYQQQYQPDPVRGPNYHLVRPATKNSPAQYVYYETHKQHVDDAYSRQSCQQRHCSTFETMVDSVGSFMKGVVKEVF